MIVGDRHLLPPPGTLYQGACCPPRLDNEVRLCPHAWGWERQKWLPGVDGARAPSVPAEVGLPLWPCLWRECLRPDERQAEGSSEGRFRSTGLSPRHGGLSTRPRGSSGSSPHGPRGETEAQSGRSTAQGLTVHGCSKPWAPVAGRAGGGSAATCPPPSHCGEHLSYRDASMCGDPQIQKGAWKTPSLRPSGYSGDRDWQFLRRVRDTPVCPQGRAVALRMRAQPPSLPPLLAPLPLLVGPLQPGLGSCLTGRGVGWGEGGVMQYDSSRASVGSGISMVPEGSPPGRSATGNASR